MPSRPGQKPPQKEYSPKNDRADLLALRLIASGVSVYTACLRAGSNYSRIKSILFHIEREENERKFRLTRRP